MVKSTLAPPVGRSSPWLTGLPRDRGAGRQTVSPRLGGGGGSADALYTEDSSDHRQENRRTHPSTIIGFDWSCGAAPRKVVARGRHKMWRSRVRLP